jgi:TPP-dependent pyruvate/acetoin dehydrogenase alpha subunit
MNHGHTAETLIAFRDRVAEAFKEKRIRSPVHFPGGNESQLLHVFEDVRRGDWVLSNWRSMYHALLAGIPEEDVFRQILDGRSMFLASREHRFLASSIVGGLLPTAVGLGMAIKRAGGPEMVWCFCGDMTASIGLFHEASQYADGHELPIVFVIEDNGFSTNADTEQTWGKPLSLRTRRAVHYRYRRTMPHVGLAERVSF